MGAAPRPRRSWSLYDLRVRAILYQVLLVVVVGLVAWFLIYNTAQNLEQRRIASGFGFLKREAGFSIGETTL
ncbi:MAG: amino acid ABC transporter permease, partial [Burkholderiales bacterium]